LKIVVTLVLALAAFNCLATECYPSLSLQDARSSKAVFVFQVVSAEYRRGVESPLGDFVLAKLKVVDRLRGSRAATYMSYYTAPECGPKINVGTFYAAFLPETSPGFVGSSSNLVVLGRTYTAAEDRARVQHVMGGQPDAEVVLENSRATLAQIPPPPPPCPDKDTRHGP
jgi:hypothetical protein